MHENSHMKDILSANPNICKGNKGNTQIVNADSFERLSSEKRAHEIELEILEQAIKDPPVGCTTRGIEAEISVAKDGLFRVLSGSYPN